MGFLRFRIVETMSFFGKIHYKPLKHSSRNRKLCKIMQINIAFCCIPCNCSKRDKPLLDWFKSKYCAKKGKTAETVRKSTKNKRQIKRFSILFHVVYFHSSYQNKEC